MLQPRREAGESRDPRVPPAAQISGGCRSQIPRQRRQRGRWLGEIKPRLMLFPTAGREAGARLPASPCLRDGSVTLPLPSCSALSLGCSGIWPLLGPESGGRSERCLRFGVRERDRAGVRGHGCPWVGPSAGSLGPMVSVCVPEHPDMSPAVFESVCSSRL